MKRLYIVSIKGKTSNWGFPVELDPNHLAEYRADGLQIEELVNIIPLWVVQIGATKIWCFFQDIFNFQNPFRK